MIVFVAVEMAPTFNTVGSRESRCCASCPLLLPDALAGARASRWWFAAAAGAGTATLAAADLSVVYGGERHIVSASVAKGIVDAVATCARRLQRAIVCPDRAAGRTRAVRSLAAGRAQRRAPAGCRIAGARETLMMPATGPTACQSRSASTR